MRIVSLALKMQLANLKYYSTVLLRFVATLPAFMAPRELVLHDELPRTSIGKIRRSQL